MCAPTLTDVTRAWSILEYFRAQLDRAGLARLHDASATRRSGPTTTSWRGSTSGRSTPIPTSASSGAWASTIGLDKYGRGHGQYLSWGYLPHEDRYQKPTIEGRNAALIMKSGVYDGATDTHKLMDQVLTREDTIARLVRRAGRPAPYDRTTCRPQEHRRLRGRYSWATAVRHARERAAGGGAASRGRWSPAASTARPGSTTTRWCSTCTRRWAGRALLLRHFARMHEISQALPPGRALPARVQAGGRVVHQADREGRARLGRHRGDPRRALPLDRSAGRQDQELPDRRADDLERGAARRRRRARADRGIADRHADRRSGRSGGGRPCLPLLRLLPGLHGARPRCQDRGGACPLPDGVVVEPHRSYRLRGV